MGGETPRIEYIEARRVLLDALEATRAHLGALVLVGAQAVYLRSAGRLTGYQAFTTDADIVVDPSKLGPIPPLGQAMADAGFVLTAEPGIWEARFHRPGAAEQTVVPIDLIVPEHLASTTGRRAARLSGDHGPTTARKSAGLEGAVVDNGPIDLASMEVGDARHVTVNVAGPAALLVAKSHKLGERLAKPVRLKAKDAGDVYRLFDATPVEDMADLLSRLLDDERSAAATEAALAYARTLFATPGSVGVSLAQQALRGSLPEPTITAVMPAYLREVLGRISG